MSDQFARGCSESLCGRTRHYLPANRYPAWTCETRSQMINSIPRQFVLLAFLVVLTNAAALCGQEWETNKSFHAAEAHQAAAADQQFLYAVTNNKIAKYDRQSNKLTEKSKGKAYHLNSGFFWKGDLYCAHSDTTFYYKDFPNGKDKSERSQIKMLDVATMKLTTFKDFGDRGGSLTWAVFHNDRWWCNFARYRDGNRKTFLAKYIVEPDGDWREQARWVYPDYVLDQLGTNSISGGVWREDEPLVTGHDEAVLYRLQLPDAGNKLVCLGEYKVPFTGQGIALDPKTGGMVGIIRARGLSRLRVGNQMVVALPPRLSNSKKQGGQSSSDQGAKKLNNKK